MYRDFSPIECIEREGKGEGIEWADWKGIIPNTLFKS